jgi:hypothetical protein
LFADGKVKGSGIHKGTKLVLDVEEGGFHTVMLFERVCGSKEKQRIK